MNLGDRIKQITKLYKSCSKCGLPTINCICNKVDKLETEARFWVLSNEKEFYRPSNTARLLKLINPEATQIFQWERTKEPEELIENLKKDDYEVYILFPAEDEETKSRVAQYKTSHKTPAFILIDGTWKEAKKIFRKSGYLKELPIISLKTSCQSSFDLRRGGVEGGLCTIEAAIEILKINGEQDHAEKIKDFYSLFLRSYKAGTRGQRLEE